MRSLCSLTMMTTGFAVCAALLPGCGGGGAESPPPPPAPPAALPPLPMSPSGAAVFRASTRTPFAAGCGGAANGGILYRDAEVEPYVAINPLNPSNRIAVWQQDRWSNGGAQGIVAGASRDGGQTWSNRSLAHSACAGGAYDRASNPWVSFAPDGAAYALSLAFSGNLLAAGSTSGMLVSRSADGGMTWGAPIALIADGASAFNDKGAVTADPFDARYVYAVWDRLDTGNRGPAEFARSSDGGSSWEAARVIYDPGVGNQTISNLVVVLDDGTLVNLFTEIDNPPGGVSAAYARVIRSTDRGATWSAPVTIGQQFVPGVVNPQTGAPVRTSEIIPDIAVGAGGRLAVVWQDARFTSGGRTDGIALSRSDDGGATWSIPVAINGAPAAQAFSPAIVILHDGSLGVSYYDFRSNTADAATLLTDYWLTRSSDGIHWSELQLAAPFNLDLAPDTRGSANGRFLGDYQSLRAAPGGFAVTYTQTNAGDASDATDIYALAIPAGAGAVNAYLATTAPAAGQSADAALTRAISDNLRRLMAQRQPGAAPPR